MSLLKKLFSSAEEIPTIIKKVGDPLTVTIILEGEPTTPHKVIGCNVLFPQAVIAPVITSGNSVSFLDGEVYSTQQHDTLCTLNTDRITVSKVLKAGEAAVASYGYLLIMDFTAVAAGEGQVELTNLIAADIHSDGEQHDYETAALPFPFVLNVPVVNKILFKVVVQ